MEQRQWKNAKDFEFRREWMDFTRQEIHAELVRRLDDTTYTGRNAVGIR
jgi:hypothetical protein